jgi:hypothetical protein
LRYGDRNDKGFIVETGIRWGRSTMKYNFTSARDLKEIVICPGAQGPCQ